MNWTKTLIAAAVAGPMALAAAPSNASPVALELSLVIDVSGSVDASEYNLQRSGYAAAFNNAGIQAQILSFAGSGGIAVNVIQFSSGAVESITWTLLLTAGDITNFANAIGSMARSGAVGSATDIRDGISLARARLAAAGAGTYEGARRVIYVSGDGEQNEGCVSQATCDALVDGERNAAAAASIRINGLAIVTSDFPNLDTYYTNHVVTPGGFASAATFATFSTAVAAKIGREITGDVPEPATMAAFGAALLGLAGLRRRRS